MSLPADPARVAAAARLLPDRAGNPALDRLAALAARLLGTASAQVSLLTDVQRVAAGAGLPAGAVGTDGRLEDSLCTRTVARRGPFPVTDARADPQVAGLPPVTSGAVGSYLGVPLVDDAHRVVGALCVFDPAPRTWSDADVATLQALAPSVVAELELAALAEEFEASRVRWELAIEAAGVGSFDWNLASGHLAWDEKLMELFGYDPSTFAPTIDSFYARIHPGDRPGLEADIAAAIEECGQFNAEYRVLAPGRPSRWVAARGRVLCGDDGQPTRMLGAAWDVTAVREGVTHAARVLETMAIGFFAVDHQWRVTFVNAEGERVLGVRREELLGRDLWEALPGAADRAFGERYRHAMRTGEPVAFEEHHPGLGAWFEVRAQPTPNGLGVYFHDITARLDAQRRAQRAAERTALLVQVGAELAGTLDTEQAVGRLARLVVPQLGDWCIVTILDDDGTLDDVGFWHADPQLRPVVQRYTELRLAAARGEPFVARALRTGEPLVTAAGTTATLLDLLEPGEARAVLTQLAPESAVVLPLLARGRAIGVLSLYAGAGRPALGEADLATARDVAALAALAVDNARSYARARDARHAAEAAGERLALLARVSDALASTLDTEEAVRRLARLVVPQLADWCVVTVVDDDGAWHEVAWAHRDPQRAAEVAAYAAAQSATMSPQSPVATALRTGQPVVIAEVDEELLNAALPDPVVAAMSRRLSPCGIAVMPLTARDRTLGVLGLVTTRERGAHTAEELAIALEVARRAGAVLGNARLFARSQRAAETLQRSLLTPPVEPDHLHVVTRYVPAVADAQVGGDWYDAFLTPDGTTTLVIGDVMGHDIDAAAAMGQLRTMVRTIACDTGAGPADVLRRVDAAVRTLGLDTYATVLVAQVERVGDGEVGKDRRLRWCSAGHPPPLLVHPDGTVVALHAPPGLLIGLDPGSERHEARAQLPVGSTLLLFTDGLVERRGSGVEDGLARLSALLADLPGLPADALADAVLERMLDGGAEDDVALVALRPHAEDGPRPAEAGPTSVPPGHPAA